MIIVQVIAMSSTPLFKWMEWRWVRLGQIVPLYPHQQLTLQPVHKRLVGQPEIVQLSAAVAVTILAACFSFCVDERPFRAQGEEDDTSKRCHVRSRSEIYAVAVGGRRVIRFNGRELGGRRGTRYIRAPPSF